MKYLTTVTEQYRVESEKEAAALIEEAKADRNFVLTKYNCEHKERKQKGEVIDAFYRVTLTKFFTDEKEPALNHKVIYEVDA